MSNKTTETRGQRAVRWGGLWIGATVMIAFIAIVNPSSNDSTMMRLADAVNIFWGGLIFLVAPAFVLGFVLPIASGSNITDAQRIAALELEIEKLKQK